MAEAAAGADEALQECIICGKKVPLKTYEAHVNHCLDHPFAN